MKYIQLKDINEYKSQSINPSKEPDTVYEVYSVPSHADNKPENLQGKEIGSNKAVVITGDVLICKINPRINRVWVVGNPSEYMSVASSEWIVVRNKSHNPEYLAWYFRSNKFKKLMNSGLTGIGGSLTRAQPKQVATYPVPIRVRKEQDNIVLILNKVDRIINSRIKQLEELDNLIKSQFVVMFGDISNNSKGFKMKTMGECCSFIGGAQPDKKFFEYEPTEHNVRLIQIRDYKTDMYITYIPKTLVRKTCNENDIMIGRYGPPIFQILKGISGAYNVALMKAVPTNEFNIEYFRYVLKDIELLQYLESFSSRTAGQDGIQMDKLRDYPCFVPPIELQNQYADFVQHVDKLKFTVQKSLDETQELFDSLMQKYFG